VSRLIYKDKKIIARKPNGKGKKAQETDTLVASTKAMCRKGSTENKATYTLYIKRISIEMHSFKEACH
jgi:hypothetical protein